MSDDTSSSAEEKWQNTMREGFNEGATEAIYNGIATLKKASWDITLGLIVSVII